MKSEQIESLVTVNPYTQGLKHLMLAFMEQDQDVAINLYQKAIKSLFHIKYYYVEGIYFYAKFLKEQSLSDYKQEYHRGLELAKKHHYRFLQYQFEQLEKSTLSPYDSKNYPLPDNINSDDFIQKLIQFNRNR